MIETPGETRVERRLRILARVSDLPDVDAGREALALLRSWTEDGAPWDEHNECMFCGERWRNPPVHGKDCAWAAARALLARCEETR